MMLGFSASLRTNFDGVDDATLVFTMVYRITNVQNRVKSSRCFVCKLLKSLHNEILRQFFESILLLVDAPLIAPNCSRFCALIPLLCAKGIRARYLGGFWLWIPRV